jgi:DNA-directed RNA polymerase sigma subunit (sigma70/sigma32)
MTLHEQFEIYPRQEPERQVTEPVWTPSDREQFVAMQVLQTSRWILATPGLTLDGVHAVLRKAEHDGRVDWERFQAAEAKRNRITRRLEDLRDEEEPAEPSHVHGLEDAEELEHILAGLSERDRTILRELLAGQNPSNLASSLGISTNAIRLARSRALRKLQERVLRRSAE